MCGIVGLIAKNQSGYGWKKFLHAAKCALISRGPDSISQFDDENLAFGHCRLSIIDLNEAANQPMIDDELVIIYNGEIFNFKELKKNLEETDGFHFQTTSDTEVILKLYRKHGNSMLNMLNGFFTLAIYDKHKKECLIARDRFGVKPLFYYEDENCFAFASEMKALLQFPIQRELDHEALYEYFQLNYIPGPSTIFQSIKKLMPGECFFFSNKNFTKRTWYRLEKETETKIERTNYEEAKQKLFELLDDAVCLRLISDVPLGGFLSGGIDSSIICGLASRHTHHLQTFSIGYEEHDFFDETNYAKLVAKHFNTDHTIFSLRRSDLHEVLSDVLNYFDEPFGDSSALPVYILSKHTRKHVKVALSGDGADEIFGGYVKHLAEFRALNPQISDLAISALDPIWKMLPKSRHSGIGNRIRQLQKFSEGMKMSSSDRYWRWCSIADEEQANRLLLTKNNKTFSERKKELVSFRYKNDFNEVLLNDVHLVLPNDMLAKVDYMSMANSLEVRTPFLDYRLVEFAFEIPGRFKLDRYRRKKIVHDAFKDFLPSELYHRRKTGFEIPLRSFLTNEMKPLIDEHTSEAFINEQKIFNSAEVQDLKRQLFSSSPDDSAARMWGLIVFQHWWKHWIVRA